jgi:hypothetical protein
MTPFPCRQTMYVWLRDLMYDRIANAAKKAAHDGILNKFCVALEAAADSTGKRIHIQQVEILVPWFKERWSAVNKAKGGK